MQHPTNLVPVSHAYLMMVRSVLQSMTKDRIDLEVTKQHLILVWIFNVPSTTTGTEELSWLSCCIAGIRHVKGNFCGRKKSQIVKKDRSGDTVEQATGLRIIGAQSKLQGPDILNRSQLRL